jgi:hypothetical protein
MGQKDPVKRPILGKDTFGYRHAIHQSRYRSGQDSSSRMTPPDPGNAAARESHKFDNFDACTADIFCDNSAQLVR